MIDSFGLFCDTYRCIATFPYIEEDCCEWDSLFHRARPVGWITVIGEDGDHKDYCPECAKKHKSSGPEY